MLRLLACLAFVLASSGCATNVYDSPAQLMALSSAEVAATASKGTEATVYEDSFTTEQALPQVFSTLRERTRLCWQIQTVIGGVPNTLDIEPFNTEDGFAMFTSRYLGRPVVVTQLVPLASGLTMVKSRAVIEYWRLPLIRDWVNLRTSNCFFTAESSSEDDAARAKDRSRQ